MDKQIEVVSSNKKFPLDLRNNCAKGEHCNTSAIRDGNSSAEFQQSKVLAKSQNIFS